MIRHVVMWKFLEHAEGAERAENLRKAKMLLDELPHKIPQILEWEAGLNAIPSDQSHDLVLVSGFADRLALVAYQEHAEHRRVVGFLRKVHCGRVVVDYERR